jgi:hypothetical protein
VALAAAPAGRLGLGLGAAALVTSATSRSVPAVVALLVGQLLSIVPDLQFRYARMPHEPSMDLWLGHISLHTGPSPVLVALGALLLGGWGWIAGATPPPAGRRARRAALVLVTVACLLARPIPTSWPTTRPTPSRCRGRSDFPVTSPRATLRSSHTGEEVVRHFECSSDE